MQFSHLSNLLGANGVLGNPSFNIGVLENPRPIDFVESSKLEGLIGASSRNFDFMGNSDHMGMGIGLGDMNGHNGMQPNFNGLCSTPFGGMSLDANNGGTNYIMDSCQRLMLPYDHEDQNAAIDVKPNPKLLSLEWQDQGCSDAGKESFGYLNGLGSWTGIMNGYGTSTTNPLV
ncbi:hypothetical protein L6164_014711 [Bauhinia variegata]|nr:hypothetical protein L6164_014711 [Bauhinia variegata]